MPLSYQQEINQAKSGFFRSGIVTDNAAISAEIAKAEKSIRLTLKRTMSFGGLKAMALVIVGGLFFAPPSLQALTQLMADPCQGPLFQALLVKGTQLESE